MLFSLLGAWVLVSAPPELSPPKLPPTEVFKPGALTPGCYRMRLMKMLSLILICKTSPFGYELLWGADHLLLSHRGTSLVLSPKAPVAGVGGDSAVLSPCGCLATWGSAWRMVQRPRISRLHPPCFII